MNRFVHVMMAMALLSVAAVRDARSAEIAEAVPADVMVYAEMGEEPAQALLSMASLPPVAALVQPQLTDPFGHMDHVLSLPPGTVSRAAPHVTGLGLAVTKGGVLVLVGFADAAWPDRLLGGLTRDANGLAHLPDLEIPCRARADLLLFGSQEALRHVPHYPEDSLARDASYMDARRKAPDASLLAYAAVPALLDALREDMPDRARDGFDAFTWLSGLDRARYLLARPSATEALRLTLSFSDEGATLLQLLPTSPMQAAAEAPADAALSLALHWGDAEAFATILRNLVTQVDALAGHGTGQDPFAEVEENLGRSLNDFAATLGSGLVVSLGAGADHPMIGRADWTSVLPLRDAAGFRAALDQFALNATGTALSTVLRDGYTLMSLPGLPASLCIEDGVLVVSGSEENVVRHLTWRGSETRNSLAGEVAGRPLALLLRADLGRLMLSYPEAVSGTRIGVILARDGADLHLSVQADVDARQLYREMPRLYSGVLLGRLGSAVSSSRAQARKTVDRNNLRQIAVALAVHRQDHDDRYPDSLAALVDGGYLNEPALVSPEDAAPRPIGDGRYRTSYEFVGALPPNVPFDVILAYTRAGVLEDGRNVLSVDGAVLWAAEWQLHRPGESRWSLHESYNAVVAAYGDALTPEIDARLRRFYDIAD